MMLSKDPESKYLFDTTVYIDYMRGNGDAIRLIQEALRNNINISRSVITDAELWVGVRDVQDAKDHEILLAPHKPLAVTKHIARRAGELSNKYMNRQHVPDMIIAATAEATRAIVVSRNTRHFQKLADDNIIKLVKY